MRTWVALLWLFAAAVTGGCAGIHPTSPVDRDAGAPPADTGTAVDVPPEVAAPDVVGQQCVTVIVVD